MTPRQTRHLAQVTARYPDAWRAVERYRRMRGQEVLAWPGWCYVPMAGAASIVKGDSDAPLSDEESSWVGIVAAPPQARRASQTTAPRRSGARRRGVLLRGHAFLRRPASARPSRPNPKRAAVPGSGIGSPSVP